MLNTHVSVLCIIVGTLATPACAASEIPRDFVYLRDIDPTIQQDMRYAGRNNFTGRPVPGYDAAECVLVRQAAEALEAVQAEVKPKGLSLRVYDCYRPTQAVADFVAWAKDPEDPKSKATYYPNLSKTDLFPDYIATRSGHSRGATLDVTLVPLDAQDSVSRRPKNASDTACTAPQTQGAPDGSLAMGTTFDCFDVKANTEAVGLTAEERDNRALLLEIMECHGFKNYPLEWWHFTFQPEPYPDTYFDFPITPRPKP